VGCPKPDLPEPEPLLPDRHSSKSSNRSHPPVFDTIARRCDRSSIHTSPITCRRRAVLSQHVPSGQRTDPPESCSISPSLAISFPQFARTFLPGPATTREISPNHNDPRRSHIECNSPRAKRSRLHDFRDLAFVISQRQSQISHWWHTTTCPVT
jgi:hypothetical protein